MIACQHRFWCSLLGVLLAGFPLIAADPPTLSSLHVSGPDNERQVWVIVAEGYTEPELSAFDTHARELAQAILAESPWDAYANWFNIHSLAVASAESGADRPAAGHFVDTAFDAAFGANAVERILDVDRDTLEETLRAQVPDYDLALVLVNDPTYGGYGSGIAIVSLHSGWIQTMLHELGHAAGHLGDEYENASFGSPLVDPEPNITRHDQRDLVPWVAWIAPSTPVPTPDTTAWDETVGLFEGARYRSEGLYRPYRSCRMRLSATPFCPVCQEALVLALHREEAMYSAPEPAPVGTALTLISGESRSFSVIPKHPAANDLAITWSLDGELFATDTPSVTISAAEVQQRVRHLQMRITDPTARVRTDREGLTTEQLDWYLSDRPRPQRTVRLALAGTPADEAFIVTADSRTLGLLASGQPLVAEDLLSWRDVVFRFEPDDVIGPLQSEAETTPSGNAAPPISGSGAGD